MELANRDKRTVLLGYGIIDGCKSFILPWDPTMGWGDVICFTQVPFGYLEKYVGKYKIE